MSQSDARYSDPRKGTFDLGPYGPGEPEAHDAFYGLPKQVKFCKRCVISNQRPSSAQEFEHNKGSKKVTIVFDDEGVCDACRMAERKRSEIDWDRREAELIVLCDRYRSTNGSYDCLVPGSGGKDSFFQSHILKYKYGMNPLTVTWAPHKYTPWGWQNFQSWIHAGFDNYLFTPNGRVHRLLTRLAVEELFHPFQPFILGQKNMAPKLSVLFNIPLVFYGENEAEYGNPIAENNSAQRDFKYFSSSDQSRTFLGGVSVADLKSQFGLHDGDIAPYLPANPADLIRTKTEIHYLGYYLKWHPQEVYYYAVENGGFIPSPERTQGTYSKYNSIDDQIDDLHYYTTFVKFGIGRATYDASQEIRSGDIDRDEGVALVKRYDGEWPSRFEDALMEYLSVPENEFPIASRNFESPVMDKEYFLGLANRFRSPHLFRHDNEGWKLRKSVADIG